MDTGGVLTFTARGEHLALPLACVVEIIRPLATARIPFAPPALLGLVNWRGTVLPVVSLAHRHGGPSRPSGDAAPASAQSGRIIVVRLPGQHAGLAGIPVESVASPGQGGHQDATLLDLSSLVAELALPPGHAAPSLAAAGHAAPGLAAQVKAAAHTPSRPPSLPAAPQAEMELVRFTAGKQDYTWPLDQVAEIIAAPPILAALPEEHPAILGAADWRGAVLPLVSLRALLGLPPTALSGCRVIVTRAGGATIGLVVDAVKPILRVPESSIDPLPPALTRGTGETRIEAVCRLDGGKTLICILSPSRLFDSATTARLQAGAAYPARPATPVAAAGTGQAGPEAETCAIFQLGTETYGLPVSAVAEIARRPARLTALPGAPDFVDGVMNLRGRVVPIVNLGRRFGVGAPAAQAGRVLIMTLDRADRDAAQLGFAVDRVAGAIAIPGAAIAPAPPAAASGLFHRIATPDPAAPMILLIDPATLLDRTMQDLASGIAAQRVLSRAQHGASRQRSQAGPADHPA